MSDEFNRWMILGGKVLVALLLLSLYLLAIAWWISPPPECRAAGQFTPSEKRWIEQRHKYHGIWASIHDESGYYFYRDGKRCKL